MGKNKNKNKPNAKTVLAEPLVAPQATFNDDEPRIVELPADYEEPVAKPINKEPEDGDKKKKKKKNKGEDSSSVDQAEASTESVSLEKEVQDKGKKAEKPLEVENPNSPQDQKEPKKVSSKPAEERIPQGDCVVCGTLAKSFCSGCKHVFYCTREHQGQDWKNHKEDCKGLLKIPYRIERNGTLGRFLVATNDLRAGQLIFNENPMLIGPRQLTKPVCLGCHQELKGPTQVVQCSRCGWPLCSTKCEDSPYHEPECRILKYGGAKVDIDTFGQVNMMYACITVLRALSLKNGPQKIFQEYTMFESHLEDRMKTEVYNKVNKEKIVFFIQHYLKLLSKFSDLEILEACGRLDTNCFELRQDGLNLRALYRTGSIISHDCTPNTKHTFNTNDYSVNFYATVNIPKGSIISASYTQPLWCTYNRREHLWMSKCFWCFCDRCKDPTEFGTELSALICSKCGGKILPTNPLVQEAPFGCSTCGHSISAKQIRDGNLSLTDELRKLDRTDSEVLEKFLQKYATILPDSHQIVREVQYGIVGLFRAVPPEIMDNKQLLKRSNYCKQLLSVAKKIDPGMSKWRGELLFQLQSASVALTQRSFAEGRISRYQAQELFEENVNQLREAIEILQVEPEGREELQNQLMNLSKMLENLED